MCRAKQTGKQEHPQVVLQDEGSKAAAYRTGGIHEEGGSAVDALGAEGIGGVVVSVQVIIRASAQVLCARVIVAACAALHGLIVLVRESRWEPEC